MLSIFAWRKKLNLTHLLDTFAPGVVMGQAIGRFACIITGDSVGKPTTGPFGLAYTNPEAMVPQLGVYYLPIYKQVNMRCWPTTIIVRLNLTANQSRSKFLEKKY